MASTLPPIEPLPPSEEGPGGSSFQRGLQWVFLGPNGIRAGWRMLIAVALFALFALVIQAILKHIPPLEAWRHAQSRIAFTPGLLILTEGVSALSVVLAILVMTFIEKRTFADYGWPGNEAFGKRFWQGIPYGFAMLTVLMALIAALHGFSHGGWALGPTQALEYGFLYLIGFILVGILEEFTFRGYLQATLASGIGFWPAAILLAIIFGAIHLRKFRRGCDRRAVGGQFRLLGGVHPVADGKHLVRNRHAYRMGLGRNVFLLGCRQRQFGSGTSAELVFTRTELARGRFGRT